MFWGRFVNVCNFKIQAENLRQKTDGIIVGKMTMGLVLKDERPTRQRRASTCPSQTDRTSNFELM